MVIEYFIPFLAPLVLTAATFFVRSYFKNLERSLTKVEGSMELMRKDLHDNMSTMIKLESEVKALWRFADNSHSRSSDPKE